MSKRTDKEYLADILEAISRIESYLDPLDYKKFLKDTKTQDAVVRNLEIIGEASKRISEKLKVETSEIPWKKMAGARDVLIHGYFGVNYDIVWGIAREEFPKIKPFLKTLL
jgi:uncharacterized protein with HEPN domain